MNQIIKMGVIGCGWITEHVHIPTFNQIKNVQVSSVLDIDIERAKRLAKKHKINGIYNDINNFLDSDIDAVLVATPNNLHAPYSMRALKSGLHVICEKPIAMNANDVKKIIEVADREHRVYLPAFVNRFRYDILKMIEIIQSNKLGEIVNIEAGWLRRSGIPRPGTWFTNKKLSGGGVLIDLGSHMVDICLMLVGEKIPLSQELITFKQVHNVENLNASWFENEYKGDLQIDVEDTAHAIIKFNGNCLLDLKLSWASDIKGDCTYFKVNGTKGSINLNTLFGFSEDRLYADDSLIVEYQGGEKEVISTDKHEQEAMIAFRRMAQYFIDSIRDGSANFLTGRDGLKTVETIENLYCREKRNDSEH